MSRPTMTDGPKVLRLPSTMMILPGLTSSNPDPIAQQRIRDMDELRRERTGAKQRAVERLFAEAGAPERYRAATFATFEPQTEEQRHVLATCERWSFAFAKVLEIGANLILWGPPGTGKTHLAAAMLREVLHRDFTAAFMTEAGLLRHMRRAFGREADVTEAATLEGLKSPDLLVLDEAGRSMGNGNPANRRAMLHEVIDMRYSACKPLVLTSNLPPETLREHFGAPAWDRLTEGCSRVVHVGGASYRQRRA